jgi:hypothetical protein
MYGNIGTATGLIIGSVAQRMGGVSKQTAPFCPLNSVAFEGSTELLLRET